uniref:C2 DOCK-type domain-containing protein n=1 Tax=Romanomermis culicivorax TaxID=13658 RepID=A0A915K3Z2_ROMCU
MILYSALFDLYVYTYSCDTKVEETLSKLLESKSCSSLSTVSASIQSSNGIMSEHEQGIKISIQQLWGTAEEVQNAHPGYFGQPPIIVRKLGFPEVISKDDVRNDLYVTLIGGDFKESNKSNIEVKAVVVDESGNALFENFVSVSAATRKETCFTSTVFYHDSKPKWNDMFKIVFPADRCDQLHIRFTFKHRSSTKDKTEKPFALAYIRLVQKNGTALKDGEHVLNLFKCEKRWEESPNAVSYLNLPSDRQESGGSFGSENSVSKSSNVQNGAFSLLTKDYFVIRTTMCSTSLTQNVELLGLLEWKLKPVNLKSSLESLMKQDNDKIGADIINFLQDILDVLFGILTTSDDYDESAFDALVYVIGLVDERRFHSFKPVMDNYLNEKFSAGLVHMKLVRILNNYLNEFDRRTNQLFCALKSLEYLIKFVVKSRKIHM